MPKGKKEKRKRKKKELVEVAVEVPEHLLREVGIPEEKLAKIFGSIVKTHVEALRMAMECDEDAKKEETSTKV